MTTYSQHTFSSKSLRKPSTAVLQSVGIAGMLLHAGVIFPTGVHAQHAPIQLELQRETQTNRSGSNDFLLSYTRDGSRTTSSGLAYTQYQPQAVEEITSTGFDSTLNVIKELSFLEADEAVDREVDLLLNQQPVRTRKIYTAKRNR